MEQPSPMSEFTVVLTAQSRIYFDEGQVLQLAPGGLLIRVFSAYSRAEGWPESAPIHLVMEVHGTAPDLRSALESFSTAAFGTVPALVVATNCFVSPPELELGFDSTPSREHRTFFQRLLPAPPLLGIPGRRADPMTIGPVFQKLANLREPHGRQNAAAQYEAALGHWRGGHEVLALAHLYMGVEAITNVVHRRYVSANEIDDRALARAWGVDEENGGLLRAEVRKRLIFAGDTEAYRIAKRASDGFEHGFLDLGDVRQKAQRVLLTTALLLRKAILESLDLPADLVAALLSSPADSPRGGIAIDRYLWGTLEGPPDGPLAPPGDRYPHFDWTSVIKEASRTPAGGYGFKPEDNYTARFAEGVRCSELRTELWDPRPKTH